MVIETRAFDRLTTRELYDLLRLRCDVFVVEQQCPYPELDGRDVESTTRHHWIRRDAGIACYARTLTEPDGSTRIGRVVTSPAERGLGLAARLIDHLVATVDGDLVLDAQSHLAGWYTRFGFEIGGAEFVEDGIPHLPMRRRSGPG